MTAAQIAASKSNPTGATFLRTRVVRQSVDRMILQMPIQLAKSYKSHSQRARVVSEAWAVQNLYCPRCDSPRLDPAGANASPADFFCPGCAAAFQLKSQSRPFSRRITDSAYEPMRRAIEENRTPHFFALHYSPSSWRVEGLTLIPSFALTLSCLERRKPLSATARRAGWVGCNIFLPLIPEDARIPLILNGKPAFPALVRRKFRRLQPLENVMHRKRGWILDVLNVVRALEKRRFSLADVYGHSEELRMLHPENLHVREKIRQQLQHLRDMGLVSFLGNGNYLLKS